MSAPIVPSQLKALLPAVSSAFCGRFRNFIKFPQLFYSLLSYERDERGDITADFCADIVACVGDGSGGEVIVDGGTLTTPIVSATDGTYTDKVVLSWTTPAGANRYEVWRGFTSNVAEASKLTDVNLLTSYSDETANPGTVYFYFVRAFSATDSSSFSLGDSGYAGTVVAELDAVTDLVATRGIFGTGVGAGIRLVWTKVPNATAYDVYRNTSDDWSTATRLANNRTPYVFNDAQPFNYGSNPQMVDNGTEIAYGDTVATSRLDPNAYKNFYYWVVPRKSNPAAVGPFSNGNVGALGWGLGQGNEVTPLIVGNPQLLSGGSAFSTPADAVGAWLVLFGSAAGGAGGDVSKGGGGGGNGAILTGLVSVIAGSKFRVVSSPESDPAAAATQTSGTDGPVTVLQYSADGTFGDAVDVMTAAAPGAGQWDAAGGGAGGSGASGTLDGTVSLSNIYAGRGGVAAVAGKGGHSGYRFGFFLGPPCDLAVFDQPGDAKTGHAGGGANHQSQYPSQSIGGKGVRGGALIVWY